MELKTVFERYHATSDELSREELGSTEESFPGSAADNQPSDINAHAPLRVVISKRGLAFAMLLTLGILAAVFGLPENFRTLLHRNSRDQIVGVREASTTHAMQSNPAAIPEQTVASVNQAPSPIPPAPAEGPNDSAGSVADPDSQQPAVTQDANAGAAITSSETSSQPSVTEKQANDIPTSVTTRVPAKTKAVTPAVPRRAFALPNRVFRRGSARARVLGTTPDGSVILGLPSGRTVVVAAPAADYVPRRRLYAAGAAS